MVKEKKKNPQGAAIAQMIVDQYQPGSPEEVQEAMKDIFGPIFEAMLQGEMEEHLGYASNDHGSKETANRRNGVQREKRAKLIRRVDNFSTPGSGRLFSAADHPETQPGHQWHR